MKLIMEGWREYERQVLKEDISFLLEQELNEAVVEDIKNWFMNKLRGGATEEELEQDVIDRIEDPSRRDFFLGLLAAAVVGIGVRSTAPEKRAGFKYDPATENPGRLVKGGWWSDPEDTGEKLPWHPPDEDLRWTSSDWTYMKGYAMIAPDLLEDSDRAGSLGGMTVGKYKEYVKTWPNHTLIDNIIPLSRWPDKLGPKWQSFSRYHEPSEGHAMATTAAIVDPSSKERCGWVVGCRTFKLLDDRGLQGRGKLSVNWSIIFAEWQSRKNKGDPQGKGDLGVSPEDIPAMRDVKRPITIPGSER